MDFHRIFCASTMPPHLPLAVPGVLYRIRRLAARVGSRDDRSRPHGRLAQRLERLLYTEMVGGSNPSSPTTPTRVFSQFGLVAQLVRAPPCHGGGRGFKSHPGRQTKKPRFLRGFFVWRPACGVVSTTTIRPSHGGGEMRAARRAEPPQWGGEPHDGAGEAEAWAWVRVHPDRVTFRETLPSPGASWNWIG